MKIVGLITEYNPFHNGHLYHLEEALRITKADKAIVIMSGDFVQRGAPAIMPKHARAKMALECGASVVIELPVRYATGSAEYFAMGAVSLLEKLGCVDSICFGSEVGDINVLSSVVDILINEPAIFQEELQRNIKAGLSFPLARERALDYFLTNNNAENNYSSHILAEPNNILGIEYLKALRVLNSKMTPYAIKRKTSNYHDTMLVDTHSSASAIRNHMKEVDNSTYTNASHFHNIESQVPEDCFLFISENHMKRFPIYADDFSILLHSKLLLETKDSLLCYQDMTIELANRMIKNRNQFISFEQFILLLKSKNITYSRISRVLIHILLNIKSHPNTISEDQTWISYAHILGFQKKDADLLKRISMDSSIPIITKLINVDTVNPYAIELLQEDIYASNLYEIVVTNKFKTSFIHEYEKSLVLI